LRNPPRTSLPAAVPGRRKARAAAKILYPPPSVNRPAAVFRPQLAEPGA